MPNFRALALLICTISLASASNFTISSEDFGFTALRSAISGLEIFRDTLNVLTLANNSSGVQATGYMFQNLWGIIYGAIVLSGWQNQISLLALKEISNNTTHLADFGSGINHLGSNSTTVFGDPGGTRGISRLLSGALAALNNSSKLYRPGETVLQAYASSVADAFYSFVLFIIELSKAIPNAFTT